MYRPHRTLAGRRGLIVGAAGEHSLAWRFARQAVAQGARLTLVCPSGTSAGDLSARAAAMDAQVLVCGIDDRDALAAMVDAVTKRHGGIDFVVHSIDWATCAEPGRDAEELIEQHLHALRISCRSFTELSRLCAAHMAPGAALVHVNNLRSTGAHLSCDLLRAIQAVLESIVRYLALELAPWGLGVHGVSSGSTAARLASSPAR